MAVCEKVGNSRECGCWKEEIVLNHVNDRVQLTFQLDAFVKVF